MDRVPPEKNSQHHQSSSLPECGLTSLAPPPSERLLHRTYGELTLPRLYRPEEIAETFGCSAWWVKDRARRRLIPHT
ncbi:hypothetical protein [Streptomyces caniscabiei]|uniref:hypothetical protein n=1 Tax=Streptomyces caniscabiei TaxID=2746961 RepID=UPI0038F6DA50